VPVGVVQPGQAGANDGDPRSARPAAPVCPVLDRHGVTPFCAAGGSLVHHLADGLPVEEVTVIRPHLNVLAGRPGDRLRGLLAQAAQAGGGRSASGVTR